ncbi:uncharacterized protein LOC133831878 [Humulus lupulus]|uniref:uncharacterized protein LOC133831878 n=1 Tax=Humulus lupulus TaxID=3486 RepID=UPI002B406C90|nr:uncharacterized protein LOC133831878 [Humulus lupulus]
MHRILLEEDSKPSIEAQRRLNPAMKEVVLEKILKWLDVGVIYPKFDSAWGVQFDFNGDCLKAFQTLKDKLISAPIVATPKWDLPFELMYDASDCAVGAVLGQRVDRAFHTIYYASRTLNDTQLNCATTEKELLAIVFTFDKFHPYLVGNKDIVYTDHSAIKDKKGTENLVADHLSRLEVAETLSMKEVQINDSFPDEQLFAIRGENRSSTSILPIKSFDIVYLKKKCIPYFLIATRCNVEGIFGAIEQQPRYSNWDSSGLVFLKMLITSSRHVIIANAPSSYNNLYILLADDYVSKWVEAVETPANDSKTVHKFLQNFIFTRFGTPRAIVSDEGSHFCNNQYDELLSLYGG